MRGVVAVVSLHLKTLESLVITSSYTHFTVTHTQRTHTHDTTRHDAPFCAVNIQTNKHIALLVIALHVRNVCALTFTAHTHTHKQVFYGMSLSLYKKN